MENCDSLLQNRKLVMLISVPILLMIGYVVWSQNELCSSLSNNNNNIFINFNNFISESNINNDNLTQSIHKRHTFQRYINKLKQIDNIPSINRLSFDTLLTMNESEIGQIIKNITTQKPMVITSNTNTAIPEINEINQNPVITSSDNKYMSEIQNIIIQYVDELSTKNYDTFNSDIFIKNIKFNHLSFEYMFSSIYNKTILFHGDSFCRKFWRYLVYAMHQKYYNKTSNMNIESGEHGILSSLMNADNNMRYNQSLTMADKPSHWLLDHEMDKIGIAQKETYKIDNVAENLWYTIFDEYYIKLILIAHTLNDNPFIYHNQFKHLNKYLLLSPSWPTLDVLFINFQALHLTHLLPARQFEKYAIEMIKKLEYHFDTIIDILTHNDMNTKCIIMRPPNPICKQIYKKEWVQLSRFFEQQIPKMNMNELKNNEKIKKCLIDNKLNEEEIYYINNITNISITGIDICSKYSITQIGVNEIDKRIKKYVFNKQNEIYNQYGVKLIYYDQLKLFNDSCDKTYDGRHYIQLLPVETVAVFNIIQKWC